MIDQWRRLALYVALGLTALAVLFPPFSVNGGPDEYGFILATPPSARQAMATMSALGGQQGTALAGDMIHYAIDLPRLLLEMVVVWGVSFALRRTVLRPTAATALRTGGVR